MAVQNSSYAVGVRNAVFISLSECIKGDFGAVAGSKFALVLRGQCTSQIGDGSRHVRTMGAVDATKCIEDCQRRCVLRLVTNHHAEPKHSIELQSRLGDQNFTAVENGICDAFLDAELDHGNLRSTQYQHSRV